MPKGRILVVDDEPILLKGLQRIFEDSGYELEIAESGKIAVEIVGKTNFDIVYTDMIMPQMNGAELCRQIKQISPQTEVILLTGTPAGMIQLWDEFIHAGGRDEILRKPLSKDEIMEVTQRVFKRRKGSGTESGE